MDVQRIALGAVQEALRPKTSGRALDAHVVRTQKELAPDYEKMRRAVAGENDQPKTKKAS